MANYNGTTGDDSFVGTAGNDTFNAGEGHNRIVAGEGHNNVNAGNGNDTVTAGGGNDTINAGGGNNVVDAGGGNNNVNSGLGNDTITTGSGNDVINAGDGTNLIRAGDGQNVVNTGSGADTIATGSGSDVINAGEGRNIIDAGAGNNTINTGSGADDILSGDGDDQINAGEGINIINAGHGHNRITAGSAADTITTGNGNDQIYAGEGANVIRAGNGNNAVYTGSSADIIETGSGNDTVYSGEGADRLSLGGGNDLVYMGGGNDVIRHAVSENIGANDDYWAEGGTDTLQLVLTAEQARNSAILADIQRFKAHLAGDGNWMFEFKAFKLTARQFERLELVAPVDAVNDTATVGEDSQVSVAVLANDVDLLASNNGALRVVSFDASSVPGNVTLADNKFTYVPGAALQHLAVGQTATVSFTYTVADDQGFTDTATVTITVVGANDAPVALVDVASGREDGPTLSGSVATNDSDVDAGAVLSYALFGPVEGLSFAANGSWSFNTSAAGYQSLAQGEIKTIVAAYKVTDQHGASATSTLTLTLIGTNDAPVVASVVSGTATEDSSSVSLNALAHASDVDNGTVLSVVDVPATLPAGVSYDPATARFSLDPVDAGYQHLAAGETLVVSVGYGVSDGIAVTAGAVSWTVSGTNDAPTITSAEQSGTVVEIADGAAGASVATLSAAGAVTFADVDLLDTHDASFVAGGADYLGTFSLGGPDQAGDSVAWTFEVVDGALDYLQPGETVTQTYTVTITDNNGAAVSQLVTVTITGTNDGPVAVADSGAGTENQALTIDVLANDTDLDRGHSFTLVAADAPQGKGAASVAGNQLVFTPGTDFDHLALGAAEIVVVSYLMSDEHGAQSSSTVTLTIIGTNDGPVAVADTGAGTENETLTLDVLANDADVDEGAVFTLVAAEAPAGKGTASVVGNQLVFAPGTDFDHLALDAAEAVIVSYLMTDEHGAQSSSTVTLMITGTNDGPVAVADSGAGTENETLTIAVLANDADLDDGALFTLVSAAAPEGKGVAAIANNQLVFTPGSDFDHLAAGAVETVVVSYVMSDEHGAEAVSTVTLIITGTNDGPVAVADTGAGDENQTLTIDVLANDTDVDDGAIFTLVSAEAPAGKGTASVVGNQLVFTPGSDFDHLAAGAVETVTLTYVMADEHGAEASSTVMLTITGTNDAPVVSSLQAAAVTEDSAASTVVALAKASDVDDGTTLTVVDLPALPAGVSFDAATNSFTFDPANAAYQSLALGQTTVVSVAYGVSDGIATVPTSVTWTVTGTNDGPVAVADAVVRTENQQLAIDVLANDTDVDNGAVLTVVGAEAPEGKGLAAVIGNKVLFAPGIDFDHLAPGQSEVVTLSYTMRDQHGATSSSTVTVTVIGTNDAPVAGFDDAAATENQALTIDVLANDTDVDAGAVLTVTGALAPYGQGVASVVGNQVRFTPGTDFDHLAAGATEIVTIFYAMRDQHGGQSAATITLTVTGTNDGPVVTSNTAAATGAVVEDSVGLTGGTLTSSDLDDGATAAWSGSSNGAYGMFVIGTGGSWTYALDNGRTATQALAAGQVVTETFTATVTDDQGATATQVVTVNVTGTNDAPVVTSPAAAAQGSVSEAGNTDAGALVPGIAVASGQLTSSDIDAGATATWSGSADGTYGAFVMSATGAWTYTLDNSRGVTQSLREGQSVTESFTTTVTDDQGATATKVVTVTVNGTNDSPVVTSDAAAANGSVVEAGSNDDGSAIAGTPSATGMLTSSDVDAGATATWSGSADGIYGSFAINAAGVWTYNLDNSRAATQALNEGQSAAESFTAVVTDDKGATRTQAVTISLTGTNDAPIAVADTGSGSTGGTMIGFEDVGGGTTTQTMSSPVTSNGYTFASATSSGHFHIISPSISSSYPNNGSGRLLLGDVGPVIMTKAGGGTFNLSSFQLAELARGSAAESLSLTGRRADGSTITAVFTTDGIIDGSGPAADYQLITPVGFTDLVSVTFGSGSQTFSLDNITVNATAGLSTTENNALTIDTIANDTDVDAGAVLTITAASVPTGQGSVAIVANRLVFTPGTDFDDLAVSQQETVTIAYTIADQFGATSLSTATVVVTGTNDAPVATADTGTVNEDAILSGTVAANDSDVDQGAVLTYSLNAPVAGLTLNANGSYSFNAGNAAYQALALGETQQVIANYTVRDAQGATATSSLTLTVTGTNDLPVAVADINALLEGAVVTGNVGANDGDVDAGASLSYTLNAPVAGLTLNTSGSYSFNAADPAYKYLSRGQIATVVANYTVTDQHGATAVSTLTITVTGTNASPVAVADSANVNEGAATFSGSVAGNDSDADGDALTYTLNSPVDGLTLNANGSYSFNPAHPSYNSMPAGAVLPVVASYTVSDSFGESATATLTIRVSGTNDAPVVTGAVTGSATEDGAVSTVAALATAGDPDTGAVLSVTNLPATLPPGVTYDAAARSFTLDPSHAAYQGLSLGQTTTVSVSYAVSDGTAATPATASWVVTGTNDTPTARDVGLTGTGGMVSTGFVIGNTLVVATTDSNSDGRPDRATGTVSLGGASSYGIATADIDGDGDVDVVTSGYSQLAIHTNRGDTNGDGRPDFSATNVALSGTYGYDVAVGDLNGDGRIDIAVAGQNGSLVEMLNLGDVDGDGTADDFATRTVPGAQSTQNYGVTIADLNGDGRNDVIHAGYSAGPTTIRFNLGDTNGDGQIDYRVQTLEDAFDENGLGIDTGDVDGDGDLDFLLSRWSGGNEVIYLNQGDQNGDGQLEFATVELPTAGDTLESELVDIDGDGDLDAVMPSYYDGAVKIAYNNGDTNGDGRPDFVVRTVTGGALYSYSIAVGDMDGDGDLDILTPGGSPAYLANQGDANGDGVLEFVSVPLTGVSGAWDAEFLFAGTGASGAYEDGPVVSASFDGDDVDGDDSKASLTYQILSAPAEGSVVNNGDGTFGFDPGNAFQDLAAGQTRTVTFTYQATDRHGAVSAPATVSVKVVGTNDAPVVAGTLTGTAMEDGASVTLNAIANASDVDTGTVLNVVNPATLPAGVTFNAAANSFTLNPAHSAYQALAVGQTQVVTVNYGVGDGVTSTAASMSWTVTGTNDAPRVAALVPDQSVAEDSVWTYTVPAAAFADADVGALLTYSANGAAGSALPGWLSFNAATRTFSGSPPLNFNGAVALEVTASDGVASVTDSFTLTVAAVDDIPVLTLSGTTATYVENGAAVAVDPSLSLVDVDGPNLSGAVVGITANFNAAQDSLSFTAANGITGAYNAATGQLVLSGSASAAQYQEALRSVTYVNSSETPTTGDRTLTFTATTNGAASQYFAANGHFYQFVAGQYTFAQAQAAAAASTLYGLQGYLATITSSAENAFVTTKLTNSGWIGASDAAVEGQWRWITGPEAGTLFYQGRAGAGGAAVNGAYNAWAGGEPNQAGDEDYGHFYADGSWNDYPANPGGYVNGYIVEFGGMPGDPLLPLSGTATVRVQPVNDAPVVAATAALNANEDGAAVTQNALAAASDVDSAVLSVTGIGTLPAGVTFNAATSSFTLNPAHGAYQTLAAGATQTVTVQYSVTDGVNSTPASVSWTVQGSNDAPVVTVAVPDQTTLSQGAFSYTIPAGAFTDVDAGAMLSLTASLADGSALPGWLSFNAATRTFSGTPPQASEGFIDVRVTASDGTLSVADSFRLTVQPNVYNGSSGNDSYAGTVRSERIVGAGGNDTLSGNAGNDVIYGGADGELGPSPATPSSLTAVAQSYYTASNSLINTLGGTVGFGEGILGRNDDGYTDPILNIQSVFGTAGLNFFGADFTTLSVNNNGTITFGQQYGSYTPSPIAPTGLPPIIAAFWTDIDTRAGNVVTSPGGTSRGTNLVYYDFDATNKVFTATWDDVGVYPNGTTPNAFQVQLIDRGSGNFDIIYRYEMIQWNYTGARAGFSSGSGTAYEFEGSGTAAVLNYDSIAGNTGIAGVQIFEVRNGQVSTSDNDVLNGGAGQDILVGGTGNDIFVFRAGEANGDQVLDFNGFGAAAGDSLRFEGYGAGATFTKIDATHWQVNYNGGASHDVITFANAPAIDPTDWLFFP